MSSSKNVSVVLVLCGAILLAGCTSTAAAPNTDQGGIRPPASDPLLAYVQPPETFVALARAEDILAAKCMSSFGFTAYQNQDYDALAASFTLSDERLYGITDASVASVYGYFPKPTDTPEPTDPELTSDTYRKVLVGDLGLPGTDGADATADGEPPSSGCLGEARKTLTGSVRAVPQTDNDTFVNDSITQSWVEAWQDPRTEEAKADWAKCMAEAGYERHDPVEDEMDFSNRDPNDPKAPKAEIQEALADIDCKVKTDFVSRANKVHVEHSNELIEAHQLELNEAKDFYQHALEKADSVIAAG